MGQPCFHRIQVVAGKGDDGKERKAANVMRVINLDDEQEYEIVVPMVLHSSLDKKYPNSDYVGKRFEIIKHAKGEGKAYSKFTIYELDTD